MEYFLNIQFRKIKPGNLHSFKEKHTKFLLERNHSGSLSSEEATMTGILSLSFNFFPSSDRRQLLAESRFLYLSLSSN